MAVGAAATEGTLALSVRRMTHERLLESKLVGLGALFGWLEADQDRAADHVPAGEVIYACNVEVTPRALLINPAPLDPEDVPPELPCRLVLLRPAGLLWGRVEGLRGGPGQFVAPPPETWFWYNRRAGRRIQLGQPGTIDVGGCRMSVTVEDISVSGARVSLPAPQGEPDEPDTPPEGAMLQMLLPVGDVLWARAQVVRADQSRPGRHVLGMRWLDLPTAVDQRLVRFIFEREREQSRAGGQARAGSQSRASGQSRVGGQSRAGGQARAGGRRR